MFVSQGIDRASLVTRVVLVALAMLAFAGNSLLCRLALASGSVDPNSFTLLRLISGALMLCVLTGFRSAPLSNKKSSKPQVWRAAISLFAYALLFSLAYVNLGTAEGALILFAAVQFTLLGYALLQGIRLSRLELCGVLLAFIGLLGLLLPSAARPSLSGLLLMAGAGVAWGVFTLIGRGTGAPLQLTAHSFYRASALSLTLLPFVLFEHQWSGYGVFLAILSGAFASALGYALWYFVLPSLSVTQAAAVQLSVPVWAALGGIVWLNEALSAPFVIASVVILSGIALTLLKR